MIASRELSSQDLRCRLLSAAVARHLMAYPEARGIVAWRSLLWFFDEDCWNWRPFVWRRCRGWSWAGDEEERTSAMNVAMTTVAGHCFHVRIHPEATVDFLVTQVAHEMGVGSECVALFLGQQELRGGAGPALTLWGVLEEILLHSAPLGPALFDSALFGRKQEHLITSVVTTPAQDGRAGDRVAGRCNGRFNGAAAFDAPRDRMAAVVGVRR